MSILTVYQFVFVASIVLVSVLAARAARIARPASSVIAQPNQRKGLIPNLDQLKSNIGALDLLFDQNKLSVEEYVELRQRINGSRPQPH